MNNERKLSLKAASLALLRGVVYLLLFLSFLLTIVSFSVKSVVAEREQYRTVMRDPAVTQTMLAYAKEALKDECLFYDLPFEIIDESLPETTVTDFMAEYVDSIYDAVFVSGTLKTPTVDAARFRAPIAARLEDVDDEVIDALATEFAAVTAAVWRSGISQEIVTPAHHVVTNVWVARFLNGGPVLAGITALLLVAALLLGLKRLREQTFTVLSVLTVSSMVLFVPFWLLHGYGLSSKLVLGDSPLKLFVVGLLDRFTEQFFLLFLWVFVITALLTVVAAVWRVWPVKETVREMQDEI